MKKVLPAGDTMTRPPVLAPTDASCRWKNYLFQDKLGEGVYGAVSRCLKVDSNEIVAVKVLKKQDHRSKTREVFILEKLRCLDPDKCNIVKFYESYQMSNHICLVFEILDISLFGYMMERKFQPLPLEDIRCITQQLAVALNALKSLSVIHADLKLDNIMVVDRFMKPLRVKLVDFGWAHLTSKAEQGIILQILNLRAPEVILGLPFSEAIDMWSLGCLMSHLFLGYSLFSGKSEYDMICSIVKILGQPQDHLLKAGWKTRKYFNKTPFYVVPPCWSLKTPQKRSKKVGVEPKNTVRSFSSLDELTELGPGEHSKTEADDRREFVNLLKQMLQMDARERITPSEVLTHPFITKSHFIKDSPHSSQAREHVHAASPPQPTVILVEPNPTTNDIETEGAAGQQPDSQQPSSQAVLNMTSTCQTTVDEGHLVMESHMTATKTEVGAPATAEVVVVKSVPPADAKQTLKTTPEVSKPKIDCPRLLRTICSCCIKHKDVE